MTKQKELENDKEKLIDDFFEDMRVKFIKYEKELKEDIAVIRKMFKEETKLWKF